MAQAWEPRLDWARKAHRKQLTTERLRARSSGACDASDMRSSQHTFCVEITDVGRAIEPVRRRDLSIADTASRGRRQGIWRWNDTVFVRQAFALTSGRTCVRASGRQR